MARYMDLHVTTKHSVGTESVAELVKMAEKLELDTICIADIVEKEGILALRDEISAIKSDVKVLLGVEVKAKSVSSLTSKINAVRELVDILIVSGGEIEINRAACENPKVDILAHPEFMRRDCGLDHVMASAAAKNNVAIELNFRSYLHSYSRVRAHILSRMQKNVMLCKKFGAPVVVTSGAQSRWDLRAGRELATLAYLCGMEVTSAISAVSDVPESLVSRVNEIKSDNFVIPGVKLA